MNSDKIFIVDDDPAYAKVVEQRLKKGGFNDLTYFNDSSGCLKALAKGAKPKFIFLDFSMISFNGLDTLLQIKKLRKKTRVLIITSLIDEELAAKCLAAGAEVFLDKKEVIEEFPKELLKIIWPGQGFMLNKNLKNK